MPYKSSDHRSTNSMLYFSAHVESYIVYFLVPKALLESGSSWRRLPQSRDESGAKKNSRRVLCQCTIVSSTIIKYLTHLTNAVVINVWTGCIDSLKRTAVKNILSVVLLFSFYHLLPSRGLLFVFFFFSCTPQCSTMPMLVCMVYTIAMFKL